MSIIKHQTRSVVGEMCESVSAPKRDSDNEIDGWIDGVACPFNGAISSTNSQTNSQT